MWRVLCLFAASVTGVVCQWGNTQIIVMPGQTTATVEQTSLNLTCSYQATQMRFLQIYASKVSWKKIVDGQTKTVFSINLDAFRDEGQFVGDWEGRGVVINPRQYHTDIQLPAQVLTSRDGGIYQCDMEDTNGKHYTNTTNAILYYGPGDDIRIHDDGTEFQVVEGQNLTLFCEAECNPACTYTWFFQSTQLPSHNGQFYIDKCNRSDAGNYSCLAANNISDATAIVQVEVFYGAGHHVWFIPPPVYQNLTEGQNFTFACLAQCHPACSLSWNKGDNHVKSENGAVVWSNVSRTESGVYTCHAINRLTNESRYLQLNVQYAPGASVLISPPGPDYVILEGGAVNLTCQGDCNPNCSCIWIKDGRVTYTKRVVSLPYVNRRHAGLYKCQAANDIGSSEATIKLDVHYAPQIDSLTINQGETTVVEGRKASFLCQVDSNPTPRVTWTNLKTQTIVKQEDTSLDSVYVIAQTECSDTAAYQCTADNGIGEPATSKINLYVACVPRLDPNVINRPVVLARTGRDAVLSVSVVAYPDPSFTWYQSVGFGVQVVSGPRYHINVSHTSSSLTIADVILKDYGIYGVNITNSQGRYTRSIQVIRADSPERPRSFYCTNHTDHSVELHWLSQDSNGAAQEFHLQYMTPDGGVKNRSGGVEDPGKGEEVYANITDLAPYTMYRLLLTATNKFGESDPVITTCFTAKTPGDTTGPHTLSFLQGIGAGIGICLSLIIGGFIIVYVAKKRYEKYRDYTPPRDTPIWRPKLDNKRSSAWNNCSNHGNNDIPITTLRPFLNGSTSQDKNKWRDANNWHQ